MGATNCRETPRQRMISMMYLVYTALLALNVSVQILNAFVTVGDSMEVTNRLLASKIDNSYYAFEKAYNADKDKVGPNWAKAQQVRTETDNILKYIDGIKYELVSKVEKLPGGPTAAKNLLEAKGYDGIQNKDNWDVATNYFIGTSENGTNGKAMELKKHLDAYQARMMELADPGFRPTLQKIQINTNATYKNAAGQKLNWQMYNFYNSITLADLVILNKFKSEIQNVEFDVINDLASAVSANDYKFDNVRARVVPKSTYIMQGESYEADVFVAAYDSHTQLRAEVSGGSMTNSDSGAIKLKFAANRLGPQKYSGVVYVKKAGGETPYPFSGEYFVAAPAVTISPTNMNVFYIGVENPVSISSPGVSADQLVPTITGGGGTIRKVAPGKFIVNVKSQQKVNITVAANVNGKMMKQGGMEFRVKPIPKPKAVVGAQDGGSVSKELLLAQGGLRAVMEGFDFPVRYNVVSFEMTFNTGGDGMAPMQATNGRFTSDMRAQIGRLRRGNKVYIDKIRVKGPDGEKSVQNASMIFRIQ